METGGIGAVITATTPAPGVQIVVATGLFAVLATGSSFIYLATGRRRALVILNVVGTIIHEAGHALTSVLTGGGVYRLAVTSAESGYTMTRRGSKFSGVATRAAGYAMPSLAGLAAALLVHRGQAAAVLTFTVVAMAVLLLVSRDLLTIVSLLAVGGLAFTALYWGSPEVQSTVACAEAWLLMTSEIGGLAYLVVSRFHGNYGKHDDAGALADETFIPSVVWIAGWFALIGWSLSNGVPLLWP